jgi:hypothetical protein
MERAGGGEGFADGESVAERPERGVSGLAGRHAALEILLLFDLEMRFELFAVVAIATAKPPHDSLPIF